MVRDFAIYRAVEAVSGTIWKIEKESDASWIYLRTDTEIQVLVNVLVFDEPCTDYSLESTSIVKAKMPPAYANIPQLELEASVIAEVALESLGSVMAPAALGFGERPSRTTAQAEAIQRAVRWMMMDPGSDIWDPTRGGGLRGITEGVLIGSDLSTLSRRISIALERYSSYTKKKVNHSKWYVKTITLRSVTPVPAQLAPALSAPGETARELVSAKYSSSGIGTAIALSLLLELTDGKETITNPTSLVVQ